MSYRTYVFNTAAAISVVPIIAGTVGVLRPALGLRALNFAPANSSASPSTATTTTRTPQDAKLIDGVVRMYAVRQLFLGFGTLAIWATGSPRTLGWTSLGGTVVAAVDAWVAKEVSGEHVAGHWIGVALSLIFSTTLLEVF